MIKTNLVLIMLIILTPLCSAVDLSEFPQMFINNGILDVVIVLGKSASSEDVIGAVDIAVALQQEAMVSSRLDSARMDNEIKTLSAQNTIIVGGPCANSAAAKIMGYPANCMEGFEAGKGIIKLYEFENNNIAMLVAGALAIDTRRAALVLANHNHYNLTGTEMLITGVSLKEMSVKPAK